jgi:hypothetical protein
LAPGRPGSTTVLPATEGLSDGRCVPMPVPVLEASNSLIVFGAFLVAMDRKSGA